MSSKKMVINVNEFKSELSDKLVRLMDSERGLQAKLAKSIGKPTSYFSEIKRGNPVNAFHLKAVGNVFGAEMVLFLLGMNVFPEPQKTESLGENQNSLSIAERRKTPQNQREGIISNFNDSETARQTILYMAEIEKLDRDHYMMLAGEIKGTARAMRPKKRA